MSKILTLKEPFASLVAQRIKHVETRSWKTNYRGEIYIHAGKAKVDVKDERIIELINLLEDKEMKYGKIIAKCKLVDCIPMTEKYIEQLKKNSNEYLSGRYSLGRYGWVLEDIEILEEPILAKGQLGIWNYEIKRNN